MVIKEWRCANWHEFESDEPVCPICGMEAGTVRVFRTAPGIRSSKTKFVDKKLDRLASTYKLGDMSNRDGEPVAKPATGIQWGNVGNNNPLATLQGANFQPGNALNDIKAKAPLPSLESLTHVQVHPDDVKR